MQRGQHDIPVFPIWGTVLLSSLAFFSLGGCADRSEKAAQEAMSAQTAFNANDLSTARKAIIQAIADRDDVAEYHVLRGRIELAKGSSSAAFNAYSNALSLDATNTEALLGVAQLGLTTGNLAASLEATERLLDLNPNQSDALLIRGIHAIIKRNYAEAIAYADKVLRASPGNEGGAVLKARALYMQQKPAEALAALDTITDKNSQVGAMTRLEIFRAQHMGREMLPLFEQLRRARPTDLVVRLDEANAHFKLGDREGGQDLVVDVLTNSQTDNTAAEQAVSLMREYGAEGLRRRDIQDIRGKGSYSARASLARFLIDEGRAGDAEIALSGLPPARSAGLNVKLMLLKGDVSGAARLADEILRRDKTDCDALDAGAGSAIKQKRFDDALQDAQRAAAECPTSPDGWLLSAQAYANLNQPGGIRRVFAQALDVNRQSARLTSAYARWLVSEGKHREGLAIARRLTRQAPALLSGWQLYRDLCRKFDQSCLSEASAGLANAKGLFGVDLPPGEPPPNGLLGRFVER